MYKERNINCTCNQFNYNECMNLKVINRDKGNMKIILVQKLQKTLRWMVSCITIVYVVVVCAHTRGLHAVVKTGVPVPTGNRAAGLHVHSQPLIKLLKLNITICERERERER